MKESKEKKFYQDILLFIKEIKESILLDTDSEPFNHAKYLVTVLQPLITNEEVIRQMKNKRLRFVLSFLLTHPQIDIKLYLNKEGFKEIFPYLKGKKARQNLQIIINDTVLQNEKKELFEQLPYQTDPELKKHIPPRVSALKSSDSVLLFKSKKAGVDIPSFAVINGIHTLVQNEEDGGFLIHFNADMSQEGEERLSHYEQAFEILADLSYPFKQKTPTSIATKNIVNPAQNQHIKE